MTGPEGREPRTGTDMHEHHSSPAAELVRLPGLFRRWELPEVVKDHHAFRIEEAGLHEDGTPLLAIYVDGEPSADIRDAPGGTFAEPRE